MTWICKNCESENPDTNKQCVVCNCLNTTVEISPKILKIQYFKSSTNTGKVGDVIELSWSVFHASEIHITGIGDVKSKGKTEIKIPKFTNNKYQITLKAKNIRGTTIHQLITIEEEKIPQILSFSSNKNSVAEGEQITLSWNVENASWVVCSAMQYNLNYIGNRSINISFNGAEQKTIYLYAGNKKEERVKKSLVIKKISPIIASFYSNKNFANDNERITLYWEVKNADTITCSEMPSYTNLHPTDSMTINISFDGAEQKTISLYAKKGEEVQTKSLTIKRIHTLQILSFSSNKDNAGEGEDVMLYWNVENASWVACSAIQGNLNCIGNRTIKISFNGAEQKTIYLYAGNKKEERVKKSLVIKKISPIIASFYSNKNFANDNERITLYWEVKNADTITCSEMPSYTNLHPTDSMTINISFDGAEQKTISLYAKKGEEVQTKSLEIKKTINISSSESSAEITSKSKNTSETSRKKNRRREGILLSIGWLLSCASLPCTNYTMAVIINSANMICAFMIGETMKKIPSIGYFFNAMIILLGILFLVQFPLLGDVFNPLSNILINISYMVFIIAYWMIQKTK